MKVTLKDLSTNKGKKKEYKFLTPLVDLLKKEYGKLVKEFDDEVYAEALNELIKKDESILIAVYKSPEKLLFAKKRRGDFRSYNISYKGKREESTELLQDKLEYTIGTMYEDPTQAYTRPGYYGYGEGVRVSLTEIYVVTDNALFEEFIIGELIKKEEEEIKKVKKQAEEEQKEARESRQLVAKYGDEVLESANRNLVKFLSTITDNPTKEQYVALKKVTDNILESAEQYADDCF